MTSLLDFRTPTWETIGKNVSDCKNIDDVLKKAHLDFEVEKQRHYAVQSDGSKFELKHSKVTVQKGTTNYFGIVSNSYKICQNSEAFDFVNYMTDDIKFIKAGITAHGICYIIAALPELEILGDSFIPHIIFQNGFNGKIAVKAAIVPLRIICQNQFSIAFQESNNSFSVKHSSSMEEELWQGRKLLINAGNYIKILREKAEMYAGIKLDHLNLSKVFDFLFPKGDEMSEIQLAHIQTKKEEFMRAYNAPDNSNFKGTAWGVINAMSDYMTHYTPRNTQKAVENKFEKITFTPYLNNLCNFLLEVNV